MYRILVPLDGSHFAEQAIPTACALARCANAELKLLHVVDFAHAVPGTEYADEEWLHSTARSDAARYLEQRCADVRKTALVPARSVVADGEAHERIQEEARSWNADLIVMATHGYGAFDRAWLGSVADRLVRASSTPVVLVRAAAVERPLTTPGPFKHVLIPLDGSPLAEQAIAPAVRFSRCSNARLMLLRVVRGAFPSSAHTPPQAEMKLLERQQEARDYLARIAQSLESQVEQVKAATVVAETTEAAEIIGYAEKHSVDLIAIATHSRSGLKRFVLGSVADKVIRGAHVPVLVVRPQN